MTSCWHSDSSMTGSSWYWHSLHIVCCVKYSITILLLLLCFPPQLPSLRRQIFSKKDAWALRQKITSFFLVYEVFEINWYRKFHLCLLLILSQIPNINISIYPAPFFADSICSFCTMNSFKFSNLVVYLFSCSLFMLKSVNLPYNSIMSGEESNITS